MTYDDETLKKVEEWVARVNQNLGGKLPLMFTMDHQWPEVACIPTGSLALDLAIGGGRKMMGIPLGFVTVLWGAPSAGKSTLNNHILANAQQQGRVTALVDAEGSFDPVYAAACGVDVDRLLISQTTELEASLEMVESFILNFPGGVVVLDSIAQFSPEVELEGNLKDSHVGVKAQRVTRFFRKNLVVLRRQEVALVVVDQVRANFGAGWGQRTETGCSIHALEHAAGLKIDLWPSSITDKEEGVAQARKIGARIAKSKVHRPYGRADFEIRFGEGIDTLTEIYTLAVDCGLLEKRGAYFYTPGEERHIAHGSSAMRAYLADNPTLAENLYNAIVQHINQPKEDADEDSGE